MRVIIDKNGNVRFEYDQEGQRCYQRAKELYAKLRDLGISVNVKDIKPTNQGVKNVNRNYEG